MRTATKAAGLCAATLIAGLTAGLAAATPAAAVPGASYASYDFTGHDLEIPVAHYPGGFIGTDSVNPQVASGASAFLNGATPFGQHFGSSQNRPYALLRQARGNQPSTTVVSFNRPLAPGTWGFAVGDVDAEALTIQAYDAAGQPIPTSGLGFRGTFNFCQGSPLPSACKGGTNSDTPTWDAGTATLTGNSADTDGASAWAVPTVPVASLVITSRVLVGIPAYQLWIAAHDQPPPKAVAPPIRITGPGEPIELPVCSGSAEHIDVVVPPHGGDVVTHPGQCSVTFTPHRGFRGADAFIVKVHTADGRILIKEIRVRVAGTLPDTGAHDLGGLALLASALLAAGAALTVGAQRVGRTRARDTWDTMDS